MIKQMNTKQILVSFLAIVSVLFLVSTVSAASLADIEYVKVDGVFVEVMGDISVVAGETVPIKIVFKALEDASDVRVKVEIEGDKVDVEARSASFDVEADKVYSKTLSLTIPSELKDEVSDDISLNVKIWNGDHKTDEDDYLTLRVQRPTYDANVKSVTVSSTVDAGDNTPVDIVLKNTGYNDLDDLYVTVSIPALGVDKTSYFGDLVAIECNDNLITCDQDDDDEDTISGRLYLQVPFDADAGVYTLEVEVINDDTVTNVVKQIAVKNDFSNNVVVTSSQKSASVGQKVDYELIVVNPTNKLKVYRIVSESSGDLSSSASQAIVAVPAGSSKAVKVSASADSEGEYSFNVNVLSGDELVSTTSLQLSVDGSSLANPVVVLTIILAIVFLVLLVVLIVLLSKKSEKSEEFGESYY